MSAPLPIREERPVDTSRAALSRLLPLLAWLGVLLPIALSASFVARFSIDVPYWDQWDFIPLLEHALHGEVTFPELTAQHNEHRILFPRLVMLALAWLTRWDVRAEIWTGWLMLVLTGLVLYLELRRNTGFGWRATWAAVPAAWVVFTLRQNENFLWGWQLQVFLAALSAVVALRLLLAPSPLHTVAAVLSAMICSYSFASGFAVWPAGALVLLLGPQESRPRWIRLFAWAGAACLTLGLYLHGYVRPAHHPSPLLALTHPFHALGFLGSTLGASLVRSQPSLSLIVGLLLLLALVLLLWQLVSRKTLASARFGLGLVMFAGVVAALVTAGRFGLDASGSWLGPGMASRYVTLTMLGIYGLFRATLSLDTGRWRWVLGAGLVVAIAASSVVELATEFRAGAREARKRRELRATLLDFPAASDARLQGLFPRAEIVRERASILRELGLGPFRPPRW